MDTVTSVAVWTGLFAGLLSIALAVVAIVAAWAVDRRAHEVQIQMIKSLQKIESAVEGISDEIKNLIKVAWERMIPSDTPTPLTPDEDTVKAITEGVAAELRADLEPPIQAIIEDHPHEKALAEQAIAEQVTSSASHVAQALRSQLRLPPSSNIPSVLPNIYEVFRTGPPEYAELTRALVRNGPLSRPQYTALKTTPISDYLQRLRQDGLLVALMHGGRENSKPVGRVVYGFLPKVQRQITAALTLIDFDSAAADYVDHFLDSVGYLPPRKGLRPSN